MKTAVASRQARPSRTDKNGRLSHAGKKIWRSRYLYLLLLPTFVWYIVFMYAPLYGAQIAFRDFMPALGITGGKWVGFKYFIQFFKSEYFVRLMKNTLGISVYSIVVGFPIPVILALLMNEVRSKYFKKGVQTIVYMPHFISAVVVVSLINAMLSPSNGLFNQIIQMFGGDPVHFMAEPKSLRRCMCFRISGRQQATALSSIWPRSPASTPRCMRRRRWTARPNGKSCCTSPCPASCQRL